MPSIGSARRRARTRTTIPIARLGGSQDAVLLRPPALRLVPGEPRLVEPDPGRLHRGVPDEGESDRLRRDRGGGGGPREDGRVGTAGEGLRAAPSGGGPADRLRPGGRNPDGR